MSLWEATASALAAIWSNKMRSFLTMLGIIIGIFAVAVLISVMQSTTNNVTGSIEDVGSNIIAVMIQDRRIEVDLKDIEEIAGLPGVGPVSPLSQSRMTLKNGTESMQISVSAINSNYDDILRYEVQSGRFISERDDSSRLRVAVVGIDVAEELFGTLDVVGQKITIDGSPFTIIGLLEEQGDAMTGSGDEVALIPLSTGQRLMQSTRISSIYLSADDAQSVDLAMKSLNGYFSAMSADDENAGYSIFSQSSILELFNDLTSKLTALLSGIAGISLLVGGIGIMNIMLVSVTERTREIGIRKAIGATRANILTQFLIESVIVSALGGILGLFLARFGVGVIGRFMDMTITISSSVIALAIGFSMGVGVLFGMYPAVKASKLNPIEALRYE